MTYAPNQPRLLADYAAAPTRAERGGARRYWRAAQTDLFAIDDEHQADEPTPCPVCASVEHGPEECPHGTAPALFEHEHQADGATVEQLAELDNVTERLAWSGTTLAQYLAEREEEADEARSTATTLYGRMRHEARRDAYADARRAADALTTTNQETP